MEKKFPFYLVLMLASIGSIATDLYLPSLPFIQADFQSRQSTVQLSLTLFLIGISASQLLYGPLSDRYGRRPIVLTGLIVGSLGCLISLFGPTIAILNLGRFISGCGFGATASLSRTILRDVYSGDDLATVGAWVASSAAGGMALAPIFGGYIQHWIGWRAVFAFLVFNGCATFYIIWKHLPETNQRLNPLALQPATFFKNYRHLITNPIFIGYSGAASLAFAGFYAYFTSSPFLFENILHLNPDEYGLLAPIFAAGLALGGVTNALLIPHLGRHRLLVTGTLILALSGVLMLALSSQLAVWAIMLPITLYSFGSAFVFANSLAGAFFPFVHIAGFTGALYGCFIGLGGILSSALISALHETNQIPLGLVLMTLGILAYAFQRHAFRHAGPQH